MISRQIHKKVKDELHAISYHSANKFSLGIYLTNYYFFADVPSRIYFIKRLNKEFETGAI